MIYTFNVRGPLVPVKMSKTSTPARLPNHPVKTDRNKKHFEIQENTVTDLPTIPSRKATKAMKAMMLAAMLRTSMMA